MLAPRVRLPRPQRRLPWPLAALHALWMLPTNIVGHAAGFLASGGRLPRRVRGPAAGAWLYRIRPGLGLDWVAAVTLGHAVLYRTGMFEGRAGRMTLAHELAHTRQHRALGPLYLPLHIAAQTTSALLSLGRREHSSRVHDHNPLEQTFICLGASACRPLANGARMGERGALVDGDEMLRAFGV
jgi:hypothetical protein